MSKPIASQYQDHSGIIFHSPIDRDDLYGTLQRFEYESLYLRECGIIEMSRYLYDRLIKQLEAKYPGSNFGLDKVDKIEVKCRFRGYVLKVKEGWSIKNYIKFVDGGFKG